MNLEILLVEDQNPFLIADILATQNGFKFTEAKNGIEAVQLARSQQFDLILMDIRLPLMDGVTAIKLIREFNETVPIIVLTAYGDAKTRDRATAAGATDFFIKPPNYGKLARRMIELTNKQSARTVSPAQQQKQARQRRLDTLKLQAAMMGINTPPEIQLEIEDLENGTA